MGQPMRIQFENTPHAGRSKLKQLLAVTACAFTALMTAGPVSQAQTSGDAASKYDFVDCRLPGVVTRLGRYNTRLQRGKLVRATARTCEIRGGKYVLEDRGSFEGSLEVWLAEASLGDAKAQTYVGELYERGPNGQPDYELARLWYKRAAEQGYGPAQFNLARFYDEGLGGPADSEKASELYYAAMGAEESLKRVLKLVDAEEVDRLNRTIGERDATIKAQRETIDRLNKETASLRYERDTALSRIASLEQSLSATRQQLASNLSSQASTLRDLEQKITALNAERRSLDAREQRLKESERNLKREQDALSASLKSSPPSANSEEQARLTAELDAARAQIENLVRERDAASRAESAALKSLSDADTELTNRLQDIANRESALAAREAELARSADQSGSERQSLESQRQALARDRQQLSTKTEAFTSQLASLEAARREIDEANAALAAQRKQIEYKSKMLQSMSAIAESVKRQQAELQERLKSVERQSQEFTAARDAYKSRLDSVLAREERLEQLEAELKRKASAVSSNEDELEELTARLLAAEARAHKAEASLSEARAALDDILNTASRGSTDLKITANPSKRDIIKKVNFGKYHAILIGNENYINEGWDDLVTPHEDVDKVAEILETRYGFNTTVLKDATRLEMRIALDEISKKMGEHDNLLIYFAGHGQYFDNTKRGFWEPVDSIPNTSVQSISSETVTEVMAQTNAQKVLVIADSCYSGVMTRGPRSVLEADVEDEMLEVFLNNQAQLQSRTVLASGGLQPVADGGGGNHSMFAAALIRTLNNNTEVIFASELAHEVRQLVVTNAISHYYDQRPEYEEIARAKHVGGDFIFVPKL